MPRTTEENPTSFVPTLYVALELASRSWKLGLSSGGTVRVRSVAAGDIRSLFQEIEAARERFGLDADGRIVSCYEAGRDSFWLARLLLAQGWQHLVLDPASIEVPRRQRRRKTDKLDAINLNKLIVRWDRFERDSLSIVQVPTVEEEDERRREREMRRLKHERTSHSNRIRSLLVQHGIQLAPGVLNSQLDVTGLRQWDGALLPSHLVNELSRELGRLGMVEDQVKQLLGERTKAARSGSVAAQQVASMVALKGIGECTAWPLALELFSFREFKNRRHLASFVGLDPTPFASGESSREQGISKAGNRRIRALMIEAAWSWVRWQPESEITLWFKRRFGLGKRSRRIGIVAVARRLLILLWRLATNGQVPAAAVMTS